MPSRVEDVAAQRQEELAWEIAARDARITELEASVRRLGELDAQVRELERRMLELQEQLTPVASLEARLAKVEAEREAKVRQPDASMLEETPSTVRRDDNLRAIRGIGRNVERALHGLGIRTFDAIASWTAQDVERFAALLKLNPQRIRRDRWVERAQEQLERRTSPTPQVHEE